MRAPPLASESVGYCESFESGITLRLQSALQTHGDISSSHRILDQLTVRKARPVIKNVAVKHIGEPRPLASVPELPPAVEPPG